MVGMSGASSFSAIFEATPGGVLVDFRVKYGP
jgi:hypothetical protein